MSTQIASSARDFLRRVFGHDDFLPGQEPVVERLLAGRSALAVFPTGGGKSLCYQLPALALDGLTLVISPLLALMKDQVDALRARGLPAARLDSTLSATERAAVFEGVRRSEARILYVAPERFADERFRSLVLGARIALFAVDEAHCISEWGHNFRPDYLKLARFGREARAERVLALTATATPRVQADVCAGFGIDPGDVVRLSFRRPNLYLRTALVDRAERDRLLAARIASRPPGSTIVYVTRHRTAEEVALRLSAAGASARPYHAGMDPAERARVQDRFMTGDCPIIVATIAFGMGIDKPDIRYVYHYNLPKSLENYSQEIGRAGRDGRPAVCELLASLEDVATLREFAERNTPPLGAVEDLLAEVFAGPEEVVLGAGEVASRHGLRPEVVRTLLVALEIGGWLIEGDPVPALYRWQPQLPDERIVARFAGEPARFLARLLASARRARTWVHLDVDQAARDLGAPRARIVRALSHLEAEALIRLEPEGLDRRLRILRRPGATGALAAELHAAALERQARDVARIGEVVRLARHPGCRVAVLAEHFGEVLEGRCGHCAGCTSAWGRE